MKDLRQTQRMGRCPHPYRTACYGRVADAGLEDGFFMKYHLLSYAYGGARLAILRFSNMILYAGRYGYGFIFLELFLLFHGFLSCNFGIVKI
jgi:hypothetical protein